MTADYFSRKTRLPVSAARAFAWHEAPGALDRLTPPWEAVRIVERCGGIENGARVTLEDRIEYALPLGPLGRLLGGAFVRRKLDRLFAWRHGVTRHDLELLARAPEAVMRIAITGGSGLIGRALAGLLTSLGHAVTPLSLRGDNWPGLAGFDAIVHLAGENIAGGRWTPERKAAIIASRVELTRRLAGALAALPAERRPTTLACASAIGYYGDRGEEELRETSAAGRGFLPETCRAWEAAAEAAEAAGIRVVHLRFGIVLTPLGGALERLLTPFRLGLGGPVGSGRQWFSWVALDDVLGAIHHALTTPELKGPVNVTAPEPVRNRAFGATLGRVLGRPAVLPLPAFAIRLAFGEMGTDLLLGSQRVAPDRLLASGYRFRYPELEGALRHLLGRMERAAGR